MHVFKYRRQNHKGIFKYQLTKTHTLLRFDSATVAANGLLFRDLGFLIKHKNLARLCIYNKGAMITSVSDTTNDAMSDECSTVKNDECMICSIPV